MDLILRELAHKRLLTLLAWTLLVILKRGISLLIELIERRIFERADPLLDRGIEIMSGKASLLPPLSDELVMLHVWPRLHEGVNISLLRRLRRVSHAWRKGVGETREWAALEMARLDSPGLIRYLAAHCEVLPPLRDRVESELRAISFLLTECLEDIPVHSEVGSAAITEDEEFGLWSSFASSAHNPGLLYLTSDYPREGELTLAGLRIAPKLS